MGIVLGSPRVTSRDTKLTAWERGVHGLFRLLLTSMSVPFK